MTLTLSGLPTHPERGWPVDPMTGIVYGVAGRWVGTPLGYIGTHGYMVTTMRGRAFLLHRVVWEACVGPIPDRMVMNHINGVKTDNRLCNLEVVTSSQNNVHALENGLRQSPHTFGPRNSNYKVTPKMHAEILKRLTAGETGVSVAADLGLSPKTVSRVKRGVRCPT